MSKKIALTAVITAVLLAPTISLAAGGCYGCTIKSIGVGPFYDSICSKGACVFLRLAGNIQDKPACSTESWHFIVDTSTVSGRLTYSFLLTAQTTQALVDIVGTGTCTLYGPSEDFRYGYHTQ